jgi:hypothetical protein
MRSYRSVKKVAISSLLIVIATVALTSGIAADPPVDHCTLGEVTSAFEAWAPGFMLNDRLGLDHAGLAEGVGLCQYRLFYDGATACFCEDDIFLGGVTWYTSVDPPNGLSPSEASEWFNQLEVQVELDGSPIDVVGTAVKGAVVPSYGQLFWQQHGVFFQLPPGDYLSTYRDCHPDWGGCEPGGEGWWESNVLVRVLPHDVAHELGPAEYPGFGSVQCPED